MRSYEPSTPRAAVGLIAIAMTAITLGALVVMPAIMEVDSRDAGMLAASGDGPSALTNAVTDAAIDFVAAHEVIAIPCTDSTPNPEDSASQDAAGGPQSSVASRSATDSEPKRKRTL